MSGLDFGCSCSRRQARAAALRGPATERYHRHLTERHRFPVPPQVEFLPRAPGEFEIEPAEDSEAGEEASYDAGTVAGPGTLAAAESASGARPNLPPPLFPSLKRAL